MSNNNYEIDNQHSQVLENKDLESMCLSEKEFYKLAQKDLEHKLNSESFVNE